MDEKKRGNVKKNSQNVAINRARDTIRYPSVLFPVSNNFWRSDKPLSFPRDLINVHKGERRRGAH